MTLGEYLLQVRTERGLTLRRMAELSHVSAAEISRLESGKRINPSPALLRAVADALVVSYPYLMQLAGYMDDPEDLSAPPETEKVYRDRVSGRLVDVSAGGREMMENDEDWAHVAYRVSRELTPAERKMLTRLVSGYLNDEEDSPS